MASVSTSSTNTSTSSTSSAGSSAPDSSAPGAATARAPATAADLQKQASTFLGLLAAPGMAAPDGLEAEEGADALGAGLSPQQALAWAALSQRQPGQQGLAQPQGGAAEADTGATTDPLHAELTPLAQGMSANGFALWRRLQDQHPGGQGDAGAMLQAPLALSDVAAAAAAPAADPEGAFAALVEKHVRQMLVSLPTLGERGTVQIRLSDAVLPDTSLSLSRVGSGWQLRAHSGDASAASALRQFAPALVARFDQRQLGPLEVLLDA